MRLIFAAMIATSALAASAAPFSPVVSSERKITFRLRAPDAQEVAVQSDAFGSQAMTKGDDGVWSYTSSPLEPEIYNYVFLQDGQTILDPENPDIQRGTFGSVNLVVIPGSGAPWEYRDVPHGKIHSHPYHSKIASHDRELLVYTPPGYDPEAATPYPVLYLFHGFSDLGDAWSTVGRAQVIFDNLIADKKMVPMVVVMPLGYGEMSVIANGWEGRNKDGAWQKNLNAFNETLITEIVPLAESNYAIRKDSAGKAAAGLSMGGAEALQAGFLQPDQFGWIGAFSSGGVPADLDAAYPEVEKSSFSLLWISCGKDDSLIGANRALIAWLEKKGVKHTWVETEGAHRWPVWRRALVEFAPLLFK